jgi:hypothetical protein
LVPSGLGAWLWIRLLGRRILERLMPQPSPRGKVFVIDDDHDVRKAFELLISAAGYEVEALADAPSYAARTYHAPLIGAIERALAIRRG